MMRFIVLFVLLSAGHEALAAGQPAASPAGQDAAAPAAKPAPKAEPQAGNDATQASDAALTKAGATPKPESLKAAVNRAINVFVPTEKIDVDKPVDFPTNI